MGGGDLNSKKSWHPNTMKNQERVWKAEQAAAEEKKRIVELQRERAEERDRAQLNNMIKQNAQANMDDRLHWMYDKPDKKVQQEEYLLGKAIDKNSDNPDKHESDAMPAVTRRVGGSSMLSASTAGDSQVDLVRKIREDPLLLIKERERAARAALLNNPLQRRKIAELLRKEQDQKKERQNTKKHKKKDKDLDSVLAAKLNALSGENGLDLAALLNSDDSASDSSSSSNEKSKKKKKKRKKEKYPITKKNKKKKDFSDKDEHSSDDQDKPEKSDKKSKREVSSNRSYNNLTNRKRLSSHNETTDNDNKTKRSRRDCTPTQFDYDRHRRRRSEEKSRGQYSRRNTPYDKHSQNRKHDGLSEEQRAARLAAMVEAGVEREVERGRRVAQQRHVDETDTERTHKEHLMRPHRTSGRNEARSLPDSLESRIHSNRHYIQRNSRHMNEHFARR